MPSGQDPKKARFLSSEDLENWEYTAAGLVKQARDAFDVEAECDAFLRELLADDSDDPYDLSDADFVDIEGASSTQLVAEEVESMENLDTGRSQTARMRDGTVHVKFGPREAHEKVEAVAEGPAALPPGYYERHCEEREDKPEKWAFSSHAARKARRFRRPGVRATSPHRVRASELADRFTKLALCAAFAALLGLAIYAWMP